MYLVYYGDQFIHDVYSNDRRVRNGKLSGDVNDYLTLEFTVPPMNPVIKSIKKHDYINPVIATFDDQVLFRGYVEDTQEQLNTEVKVSCKSDLAMLTDSLVRPYTMRPNEVGDGKAYVGPGLGELFTWLVQQHNSHVIYIGADGQQHGTEKQFQIKYPSDSGTSFTQEFAILDKRGSADFSSQSNTSTLSEIQKILKARSAYIQLWYDGDTKCLAFYADVPKSLKNNQVIQFGQNMTDYLYEDSCRDIYTAIRATGGNSDDGHTITLARLADGVKSTNFYKRGDVVYHMANAEKYGYREYAWSNSNIMDANVLLTSALAQLQAKMIFARSIEVSAMDMVFVNSEYKHLLPGQVATVQSAVHNLNVDVLVSSCNIDFDSPGSTKYTMGSSAAKITKTYGSIMEEITVATDTAGSAFIAASNADKNAGNANVAADVARQIAQQATAVTIKRQGTPASVKLYREGNGDDIITPSSGVSVSDATLVATGSVRQVHISFTVAFMIQSGTEIGTLQDAPAIISRLTGITGHIGTNGVIVIEQDLKAGVTYEIDAVFVLGVKDV